MQKEGFKSGFATLVGRPNAGKSTLLNAIMGKKIAITSSTAQTTRHRFRAVLTRDDFQLILVDTPGIHKPHDALGEELNESALKGLQDIDVVAMVIDASQPIGRGDEWVAKQVAACKARRICVLSKTDIATPEQIAAQREAAEALMTWDAMVALSARSGANVDAFVEEAVFFLSPSLSARRSCARSTMRCRTRSASPSITCSTRRRRTFSASSPPFTSSATAKKA